MSKQIYMDYAAATPLDERVLKAMAPYWSDSFYNPSATYLVAKKVAKDIEKARADVALHLGAKAQEIIFTAGGTEANNLAIQGVMQANPDGNIVVSAIEHESVLNPAFKYQNSVSGVQEDGIVSIDNLKKKINDKTVLVSIMYANNEIGSIQPLREIAKYLQTVRDARAKKNIDTPLYFHTDACQAPAYLDLHVSKLGVDLMTINGGKIYGPKQSGVLYIKSAVGINALILGGGQENRLRSGTENVPGIIGLAKALDIVQSSRREESDRLSALQETFTKLLKTKLGDKATINGNQKKRLPNNINVAINGHDNERLVMELDEQGVLCAVGSACSAGSEEPSHVLKAIGLSENEIKSSIRFSFGKNTTEKDIIQTVEKLLKCL